MEEQYFDNTFLARWISGELSHEEIEVFKKSKDYPLFKKINEASQTFENPLFDADALFNKMEQRRSTQEQKIKPQVIKLIPNWAYGVAASVIIAFGIFYVINMASHYQTDFNGQLAVVLPDHSKVELNSNSQLDFKSRNWDDSRDVTLNGEAFFDVEKGKSFKVHTNQGIIEVLGTEFNVISRDNYFEVQCHEGRVRVSSSTTNKELILLPGNAVRVINNTDLEAWDFTQTKPNWLLNESTFVNMPLSQVIIALENQFKVTFDISKIDTNNRFTGGFSHKDLKLALKTVFIPMEISYKANDENTIILLN